MVTTFLADDGPFLASGVAYQLFFSLIPLLALVVGALAFVYGADRAERELVQLLREVYPSATAQEVRVARQLVDGRALSLSLGVIGTILGASAVFGSLDTALASVLRTGSRRTFMRGHAYALGFVAGIAVLAVVSFGVSYGAQAAQGALRAAGFGRGTRLFVEFGGPAVGLLSGWAFFYVIYLLVPRLRPPTSDARLAALVSAVLWEVAKVGFGYFTRALGAFTAYGPLAFAAGLLTWVYVTAVIIIIGAEVLKVRVAAAAA